jgi:hypothetical protein
MIYNVSSIVGSCSILYKSEHPHALDMQVFRDNAAALVPTSCAIEGFGEGRLAFVRPGCKR